MPLRHLIAILFLCAGLQAQAQPAAPVPGFEDAYRAWELVTDIARQRGDRALGRECTATFQPFVVPALRRQTQAEKDASAVACVRTARALCAQADPTRTPQTARRCADWAAH